MTFVALAIGFGSVALLGAYHHGCLRLIDRLTGADRIRPNITLILVFLGLLALHTSEILILACAYRALLEWPALGDIGALAPDVWADLIYFSGMSFVTLGYSSLDATGPIRLVGMMQSLGGFMLLTWSATFIYSAWSRAFRE